MRQLYLIRGLPGSGKSTLAQQIADESFEADRYFMVGGEYKFDISHLQDAHHWCQAQVGAAMQRGVRVIAVSNTFVRRWEMLAYINMAKHHGYAVTEMTMSGPIYGTVHGVPDEKVEVMRARWEK
jgi:predicted kinase